MRKSQKRIINKISEEILYYLCIAASEEYTPQNTGDQMDHLIADSTTRVNKLRDVRYDLEAIFTGKLI